VILQADRTTNYATHTSIYIAISTSLRTEFFSVSDLMSNHMMFVECALLRMLAELCSKSRCLAYYSSSCLATAGTGKKPGSR